jgi:ABC-2 type transport system ATP-binding protein
MTPRRLIDATGVTRRFGTFTANDGIDLAVDQGEVVGLLGANGAGKTTFMRLVLGLLRPSGGTVRLFGRAPSRAVRSRVGYMPQGLGLYEDLTVAENLHFAAGAYRTGTNGLVDADLRSEADTLVRELPLGLRRRLAFATALGHDPRLLVLDEPTSGVDPLGRSRLWDTIRDTADRGAGVLVSTHYMEEAEHCDRLVVLANGRVLVSGTLERIIGGRRTLQITTPRWDAAFQALDTAGMIPSLHGRTLRLIGADEGAIAACLRSAGIDADLRYVPANFEEAFVALITENGRT